MKFRPHLRHLSQALLGCMAAGLVSACSGWGAESGKSSDTSTTPTPQLTAATALTWTSSSPSYGLTVTPTWTLATGDTIASQSIQYYSDGTCGVTSGAPVTLSASATTHSLAGSDLTTYSYKITTVSSSGASVVSACSSAMILNAGACVGARLTNTPYADGTGSALDPFLICTPAQMNAIGANSADWSKNFRLLSDLDLSAYTGTQYNIIGTAGTKFTGVFEGSNHTISNFTLADTTSDGVGLFGYVSGVSASIQNLKLANVSVSGKRNFVNVGALVGDMNGGTVSNCHVLSGSVSQLVTSSIGQSVGGLIGIMSNSASLTNSTSAVTIPGASYSMTSGGLVGSTSNSTVSNSGYTGTMGLHAGAQVGGLIGNASDTSITECYSSGTVKGGASNLVGGLVGSFVGTSDISKSYVTGTVFGNASTVGGLVGQCSVSAGHGITNSYSRAAISGAPNSVIGGLVGKVNSGAATISNNYSTGAITLTGTTIGGFVGQDANGGVNRATYTANFFDVTVNPTLNANGVAPQPAGVAATSTANMQLTTTFSGAGWTSPTWNLTTTGSYLKLGWEP